MVPCWSLRALLGIIMMPMMSASIGALEATVGVPPPALGSVVVAVDPQAAPPERFAAGQLSHFFSLVAGLPVPVLSPVAAAATGRPVVAIGVAAAATVGVSPQHLTAAQLGSDGYFCATAPDFSFVALSGGFSSHTSAIVPANASTTPRGTVNAVFAYLRSLGFKFLAPNVTLGPGPVDAVPQAVRLARCDGAHVPSYNFRLINPAFLPIGADPWGGADGDDNKAPLTGSALWWVANGLNGAMDSGELPPLPAAWGGSVHYAGGFVHTSEDLVPAARYPAWYGGSEQLCWSNTSLVTFLTAKVRSILAGNAAAANGEQVIVSVSQNDVGGSGLACAAYPGGLCYCNTPEERSIIEAEGSPMGPMLRAVNAIAAAIADDYPNAAVETLAYDYTIRPPRHTRPRGNVLITFCTMSSSSYGLVFRDAHALPLTDPANTGIRSLLAQWGELMPPRRRSEAPSTSPSGLRVWDYVENFDNYLMPVPNWHAVGENLQYLAAMGVTSYFGESDHGAGHIAEMNELRAWVEASMMFNATLDPKQLVDEFVLNFYGRVAHPHVMKHMDGWERSLQSVKNWTAALAHGGFMECGNDPLIHPGNCYDQPWVTVEPALNSAAELNAALVALKGAGVMGTTYASRVEKALISSWWVLLMRWEEACAFATKERVTWPLHSNMSVALAEWVAAAARQQIDKVCNGIPGFTVNQSYADTSTAGKVCHA